MEIYLNNALHEIPPLKGGYRGVATLRRFAPPPLKGRNWLWCVHKINFRLLAYSFIIHPYFFIIYPHLPSEDCSYAKLR